ncbi:hypothetical protein BU24DRAFT_460353 [Aaosphaeria arxii CBS 175.79]|uniref:WD40 repeat-like protein n=1 Tax=Aaosphaeria arxii CBS 175.79 TaxID=1450172 RepID=A0A6A5XVD7_9PLEO|nr:uncharacterized protein BU24DRAFT_460353 [Aaosphaeria arxii CBS 175.79]KAF2017285.1 hypothetical protein BU24DRAFT_460353 [Aaosphaeria arxii CBS 175.79]
MASALQPPKGPFSPFESETFCKDVSIELDEDIGAASISPSGRDVVLANKRGLQIIDLDNPYSAPRQILNKTDWEVADVQWSPFASRSNWIAGTCNQKALIYNVGMSHQTYHAPIQFTLHSHERAITDINFSAHNPDVLATCAVDSYIMTWDLRDPGRETGVLQANRYGRFPLSPTTIQEWTRNESLDMSELAFKLDDLPTSRHREPHKPTEQFANFEAAASQVKWNRRDEFILASSHDKYVHIWDTRKGATPLTTILAHNNKVCGIDWHRSIKTTILTCSLDKTIKIWDDVGIRSDIFKPSTTIRTLHPVRRARHTPFPNGILSIPQRGDTGLSLYTQTPPKDVDKKTGAAQPAHVFQAHAENSEVLEFLWRARGSAEGGFDDREFQLVSLGTDRHLNLYTVPSQTLFNAVGFKKGVPVVENITNTRKDADYASYRDGPQEALPTNPLASGLSALMQNAGRLDSVNRMQLDDQRATMTAQTIRQLGIADVANNMRWIHGVKVGERHQDLGADVQSSSASKNQTSVEQQKDLKAEISHVGQRYSNIKFEKTDFQSRSITVTLNGPWGEPDHSIGRKSDRKLVFLRLTIYFPDAYPNITGLIANPLEVKFHKTTAAIDENTAAQLQEDLLTIADRFATVGLEALDAVVCYALGERSLEDTLAAASTQSQDAEWPPAVSRSTSSDDEDEDAYDGIGQNLLDSSLSDANIPVPIQCTARFAAVGFLVLSRPPKPLNGTGLSDPVRLTRLPLQGPRNEIFESFGRLDPERGYGSESPTSSTGSWDMASSASTSSSSGRETNGPIGQFQPPLAWQRGSVRFLTQQSHPSSLGASKTNEARSVLTILGPSVEDLIPSKRKLAEEYRIFGDGPSVCLHNSEVARKSGLHDLADIWLLCKLILNNEVPLEILPQQHRREQVLVLARRALVRIKRKDSGLDLQFDEADTVTNPKLRGRIKWGHHSVVTWLVPALFDHFERQADIQMLAMLSCIFCEPAAREGVTSAMARMKQSSLPMSMEAPAFSLDYFSSADAAWSLFKPTISIPSTPAHSRYATPVNEFGWHRFTRTLGTYGSHGSSNGPWGSDTLPSEPVTPYSTGSTPPTVSRVPTLRSLASHTPYSSSPEQLPTHKRSSTANFANAIATLSRPFANAVSSSPPVKNRTDADLSTSAPTAGVTWGTTTFFNSGSQEKSPAPPPPRSKHGKRASFGQADRINIDYYSDSDSEYGDAALLQDAISEYTAPLTPRDDLEEGSIKVTLKNQDQFDDEASVSAPLLDMGKDWLYKAWREQYAEMLGRWGLISKRAEVLKYNGLISYFPPESSRAGSKAGSVHLAFKSEVGENASQPSSTPLSRSSTLAPPTGTQFRRTPTSSPRQFSFNPEAHEFRPGGESNDPFTLEGPSSAIQIPGVGGEQYPRSTGHSPSHSTAAPELLSLTPAFPGSLESSRSTIRSSRPSIGSRQHSTMSRNSARSSAAAAASTATATTTTKRGGGGKEQIYSCTICWLRVGGRFFLCPSCGHVAHFGCMDFDEETAIGAGIGWEEGECVVGCGCGCGFEGEEVGGQGEVEDLEEEADTVVGYEDEGGRGRGLETPRRRIAGTAIGGKAGWSAWPSSSASSPQRGDGTVTPQGRTRTRMSTTAAPYGFEGIGRWNEATDMSTAVASPGKRTGDKRGKRRP